MQYETRTAALAIIPAPLQFSPAPSAPDHEGRQHIIRVNGSVIDDGTRYYSQRKQERQPQLHDTNAGCTSS